MFVFIGIFQLNDVPCPSPIPNPSDPLTSQGLPIVSDTAQGDNERHTGFNGRFVSLVSLLRVINTVYRLINDLFDIHIYYFDI